MKSHLSSRLFSCSAAFLSIFAALAAAPSVRADVVFSNLPFDQLGSNLDNSTDSYVARAGRFNTGAFSGSLTSVEAAFRTLQSTSGSSVVNAYLFSDSGSNSPDSIIANLGAVSVLDNGNVFSAYSFSPSVSVSLTANTDYWIGFEKTVQDNKVIQLAVSQDHTTSSDSNAFNDTGINGPWSSFTSTSKYAFQVNGSATTAVPEASALALLAPGLLGVATVIRRRKK